MAWVGGAWGVGVNGGLVVSGAGFPVPIEGGTTPGMKDVLPVDILVEEVERLSVEV